MDTDSIQIICSSCAFSRTVPLTKLPATPVKVTCPQCRHAFTFAAHLATTGPLPELTPALPDRAAAPPCTQQAIAGPGARSNGTSETAAGAVSDSSDIPQKYRDFADDYNSGLDQITLCRKFDIPDKRFPGYVEFLKRKGLNLAERPMPLDLEVPSPGKPEPPTGKATTSWKKSGLFEPIENREGALKMVWDAAKAFYLLAGIQILIGLFLMPELITDGIGFVILAFCLHKFSSRVAASLLLLLSGISLLVTVLNLAGVSSHGGRNIWLAVIVVVVAARATEATFRLHGQYRSAEPAS